MVGAFWGTTHREGPGGSGGEEDNSSPPRSERARKMVEAMDVDTVAGDDGKARDDVLYIPARGDSDLTVVLPWTDMKDAELVVDLFKAEEAPLHFWIDAARVYYNKGLAAQYAIMLKELTSDDVGEHYGESGKVQRVQAFCALAETKIEEAKAAKNHSERESALVAAQNYLSSAAAIDPSCEVTEQWFAIGQLQLAKEEYPKAKISFENSLLPEYGGKLNCSGHLGSAYCCYRQGKYTEALGHYGKVMKALGSEKCPNYVRLAMAACYLQLKKPGMAELCYKRAAAVSEESAEARAGLGALKVLSSKRKDVEEGLGLLKAAYELNPHLSFVLVSICEQLYYRNEYSAVAKLAQAVLTSPTLEASIKAEAYYYLGMVYYLADQLDQALTCFRSSLEADSGYIQPNHGMARVYVRQGNIAQAIEKLEIVVEANNSDLEALINLSVLYKAQGEMQKAVKFAERAHFIDKGNILLEEYLANLLAGMDAKKALTHYNHVIDGKGSKLGSDALLMVNNTGVIHYQCGDYTKALTSFVKALKIAEKTVYSYPIKYNIARTHEALGSLQKASNLYKDLLKAVPGYLECILRLAAVCFSMGYEDRSILYCQEGLKTYPNNPECLAMLVWIFLTNKKARHAHQYIREMDKHCKNETNFIDTAMGCMYLIAGFKDSRMGDREKFEKMLNSALTMFKQAVSRNPRNMFAAHGLGVCFALLGKSLIAKRIFDRLLEASKQDIKMVKMPEVLQNKGSINLESGHYEDAWKTYAQCQNLYYGNNNVGMSHLMVQALNAAGKKDHAIAKLLKTMHLDPCSLSAKYCLAVVLTSSAQEIINSDFKMYHDYTERKKKLEVAQQRLSLAKFYIEYLMKQEDINREGLSKTKLKDLRTSLVLKTKKVEEKGKEIDKFEELDRARRAAYQEEVERDEAITRTKEEIAKKEQRLKEKELEDVAKKNAEKLAKLQEKWNSRKRKSSNGTASVKKDAEGKEGDPFLAPDDDEGAPDDDTTKGPWSTDLLGSDDEQLEGMDKFQTEDAVKEDEAKGEGEDEAKTYKPPTKRKKIMSLAESDSE